MQKVYMISLDEEGGEDIGHDYAAIPDSEWIDISTAQGNVFTLNEFAELWNTDNIIYNSFVRII